MTALQSVGSPRKRSSNMSSTGASRATPTSLRTANCLSHLTHDTNTHSTQQRACPSAGSPELASVQWQAEYLP